MKVIYNGVDIADKITLISASYIDRFLHKHDDLQVVFLDEFRKWPNWGPKTGDSIKLVNDFNDSGLMYVDSVIHSNGVLKLKAIPVKDTAKTVRKRTFEKITLIALGSKLAGEIGLNIKTYNVPSVTYDWIDQPALNNLEFLSLICKAEGLSLKVFDGNLIIASYEYIESLPTTIEIDRDSYPNYELKESGPKIGGYDLISNGIKVTYRMCEGAILLVDNLPFSDATTGQRFAKNLTEYDNRNRRRFTVSGQIEKAYAGKSIKTTSYGGLSDFVVDEVISDLIKNTRTVRGYVK